MSLPIAIGDGGSCLIKKKFQLGVDKLNRPDSYRVGEVQEPISIGCDARDVQSGRKARLIIIIFADL